MAWHGMVEVCEGAPVAMGGWVLNDRPSIYYIAIVCQACVLRIFGSQFSLFLIRTLDLSVKQSLLLIYGRNISRKGNDGGALCCTSTR